MAGFCLRRLRAETPGFFKTRAAPDREVRRFGSPAPAGRNSGRIEEAMHRKTLGSGGRRARRGFTLVELAIAMSMLMIGMVSAASATMRMHHLRKQNRERIVAQNALRS